VNSDLNILRVICVPTYPRKDGSAKPHEIYDTIGFMSIGTKDGELLPECDV
jgi:hypothetical protein